MCYQTSSIPMILLVCAATLGCGRGETLGTVHGKVTLQGKPVTAGIVVFSSKEKGVHMTASLQPDGGYELQMARGFGLPLGTYQIAINPPIFEAPMPGKPDPQPKAPSQSNIPLKYYRFETSGLSLTVVDGDNPFDIDLHPSR
jgi:hypothetical protein